MKRINRVRKAKVKQALLENKPYKQATLEAGYSKATSINAWRLAVVKCCLAEIEEEYKAKRTIEDLYKDVMLAKKLSLKTQDITNYNRANEFEGKILGVADKHEIQTSDLSSQEKQERIDKLKRYFATDGSIQSSQTQPSNTLAAPENVQPGGN